MQIYKPKKLKEALNLYYENPKAYLLAGGTDIVVLLKKIEIETLIDINSLKLNYIKEKRNSLTIGALTTISDMQNSKIIQKHFPILIDTFREFGSLQIRNMATIGGNIANASPAGDLIPPLLALNASIKVKSINGTREIKLSKLYKEYKKLNLKRGEIITEIKIPLIDIESYYYKKIGKRESLNIAVASLAFIKTKDKILFSAGSAHEYPKRLYNLEKYINKTKKIDSNKIKKVLKEDINPRDGLRSTAKYRNRVIFNMIMESLNGVD